MNKLSKEILINFFIGVIVFVIGNAFYNQLQFSSLYDFLISFAFYQVYTFVISFSNTRYFSYLDTLHWADGEKVKRILVGFFGSIVITLADLFVLRLLTAVYYDRVTFKEFIVEESYKNYTFGLWITLTIVTVYHFIYYYNEYQKRKVKDSQKFAKQESAKFESLKNQLDPHFLFNSLNVLTSLIGENPQQAEKFTTKLSKIYRYVLEQRDKDLTLLEDELQFAKSYMELLKMRFEDAVIFTIPETVSNPELKILPLSLQLLLENAVKHNVITSQNPLIITIYEDDGFLVVENNINPKGFVEKSTKVGLQNIKHRYSLITKRAVEITDYNKIFKVKLPLLTQQISVMKTDYINDSNKYIKAKKRVDDLKEFYGSLISYCVVIPFLIFINYRTYWGFQWFWFPMFGWGLGLVIQAFKTFGYGTDWEDRKIREYMEKDKNRF
ncbi:2TM domain-containing protein [Lutibacter sp. B1]|uniref:2TM domain-containing protein n=1 Tax=Lutibacter sp. B1 TaxID=2725996 RepID=UPI001456D45A|nr:2TM domain-containing protein [Lutibacter sp. B1]NLP57960.1 Pr2TM family membrane protein [Lutibacter sp. B1]